MSQKSGKNPGELIGRRVRIAAFVLPGALRSSTNVLEDIVTLTRNLLNERLDHQGWAIAKDVPEMREITEVERLSLDQSALPTFDGSLIDRCRPLDDIAPDEKFDFIFLPSLPWEHALMVTKEDCERIGAFLREQHDAGAAIAAQGGAVAVLAASHLLDGGQAAVFWSRLTTFRSRFPEVFAETVETITFQNNIGSASTMAAGPPLICRILDRFTPAYVATSLRQQVFGGDAPYPGDDNPRWDDEELLVARSRVWIAQNYHLPIRMIDLAETLDVSERTLSRHFNAALGMTPHEYLRSVRFDAAMRLLTTTEMRIDDISQRVGYANTRYFARSFRNWFGLTPTGYRERHASTARSKKS